jgi:hypothetical protein
MAQQPCKSPNYGDSTAKLSYGEIAAARFAAVTGTVRDTTGSPIEGTSVELVRLGTNEKYDAVANKQGVFSIDSVEPGAYAVRVESNGFQHYRAEEIRLRAGNKLQLEVDLAIGSVGGCALLPASETHTHWASAKKTDTPQRGSS